VETIETNDEDRKAFLCQRYISARSDIDLAVSGIPAEKIYAAVGAVTGAVRDFKVDVLDLDDCKAYFKKTIEREGIEI